MILFFAFAYLVQLSPTLNTITNVLALFNSFILTMAMTVILNTLQSAKFIEN